MPKFCPECGSSINDGCKFCLSCGASIPIGETQTANKSDLLENLRNAKDYFFVHQAKYEKLNELKTKCANDTGIIVPSDVAKFGGKALLISVIVFIFSCICTWGFVILAFFVCFGVSALAFVIAIGLWIYDQKTQRQRYIRHDKELENMKQEAVMIENELVAYYSAYPNCPISFEYSYPPLADKLINLIDSGRADNVKEAIQCMLDDEHKAEMLNLQSKAAEAAKEAARSARSASIISSANYLRKR